MRTRSSPSAAAPATLRWVAAVVLSLLAVAGSEPVSAWGLTGHRIIGAIAEERLGDHARREIDELIGPENLVDISVWADDVKSDPAWDHAYDWHFVSVPDGVDPADAPQAPDGDVLRAVERFVHVLGDPDQPKAQREIALRFLVHFVGDAHQPLHVGRLEDRGGNEIEVEWFGRPTNLHWVWDTGIQAARYLSYSEHAERILRIRGSRLPDVAGDPLDWARESMALRPIVYDLPPDRDMGYDYLFETIPIAEERLGLAGARLAALLEDVLGSGSAPAETRAVEARPLLVGIGILAASLVVLYAGRRR